MEEERRRQARPRRVYVLIIRCLGMLKLGTNLLIIEYMSLVIRLTADSQLSQSSSTTSIAYYKVKNDYHYTASGNQSAGLV
jgi:hypothetical protein